MDVPGYVTFDSVHATFVTLLFWLLRLHTFSYGYPFRIAIYHVDFTLLIVRCTLRYGYVCYTRLIRLHAFPFDLPDVYVARLRLLRTTFGCTFVTVYVTRCPLRTFVRFDVVVTLLQHYTRSRLRFTLILVHCGYALLRYVYAHLHVTRFPLRSGCSYSVTFTVAVYLRWLRFGSRLPHVYAFVGWLPLYHTVWLVAVPFAVYAFALTLPVTVTRCCRCCVWLLHFAGCYLPTFYGYVTHVTGCVTFAHPRYGRLFPVVYLPAVWFVCYIRFTFTHGSRLRCRFGWLRG